jgi:hypothetical protein
MHIFLSDTFARARISYCYLFVNVLHFITRKKAWMLRVPDFIWDQRVWIRWHKISRIAHSSIPKIWQYLVIIKDTLNRWGFVRHSIRVRCPLGQIPRHTHRSGQVASYVTVWDEQVMFLVSVRSPDLGFVQDLEHLKLQIEKRKLISNFSVLLQHQNGENYQGHISGHLRAKELERRR